MVYEFQGMGDSLLGTSNFFDIFIAGGDNWAIGHIAARLNGTKGGEGKWIMQQRPSHLFSLRFLTEPKKMLICLFTGEGRGWWGQWEQAKRMDADDDGGGCGVVGWATWRTVTPFFF